MTANRSNLHDVPLNLSVAIEAFAVVRSETGVTAVPTFPVVRTFGPRKCPPNSALQCDNAANLRDSTKLFVLGHRKQNQPSNVSSAFTTLRVPGLLNRWEVNPTRPRAAAHLDHGDGHTALFPFRPDDERRPIERRLREGPPPP